MDKDTKKIIGDRIKYLRTHNGYTQEGLANILGLKGKSSIANYESGNISPSDSVKIQICNLFGCSLDYLMGYSDFRSNKHLLYTLLDDLYKRKGITQSIDQLTQIGLTYSQSKIFIKDILFIKISNDTDCNEQLKNYISNYDKALQKELYGFALYFLCNYTITFKSNSITLSDSINGELVEISNSNNHSKYPTCPVYHKILAQHSNWTEDELEDRLPINEKLMAITNPKEYYFLRINEDYMDKIIKKGSLALIHKQDSVEDGEIAVVVINKNPAILRKYTKQGDFVILEPLSDDINLKPQVYDKNTPIKILGKYVGKFEMN